MRLIALELHGFKSFADPQKLLFPGGMTAVVGPNGCGKSNISDALAWVLGEQRATLLRGAEMSDVIFAGTSDRKPTGLAEVKLVLSMLDPATQLEREVVIARRLYRDAGAEYRINGQSCRLKDIQDLLMDTGMGTRAYSFIQQGQIDLILSTKPKDRRSLLEEAAGITRYKLRRQDAERRLEDTRANLLRLDDILHELSKQQESLKRQASKARRAQELDSAIRALKRILLAGKALELETAKEAIVDRLDSLEREIASLTAQGAEKASEVEDEKIRLDEMQMAQEKRSRNLLGLEQRLGLAEQDRGFQEERVREIHEQSLQLEDRINQLENRTDDSQEETERVQAALEAAEKALEGREEFVSTCEERLALATGVLKAVEVELRELRAKRMEAEKAAMAIEKARRDLHQQLAQLEGRLDALNHEEALRAPRLDGLLLDDKRMDKELEGAEDRLEQIEEAVHIQSRSHQEAQEAQKQQGSAMREAESLLDTEERKLRQLGDELRKAQGDEETRKALSYFRDLGEEPLLFSEVLHVDDAALGDLERILGSWTGSCHLSESALESLAEAPGMLCAALNGQGDSVDLPEHCEPILQHIQWKQYKPRILEGLLSRIFQCQDTEMPRLARQHPHLGFVSPRLVKLPFGPIQAGVAAPAFSPLKLRSELDACKDRREELLERLDELEAKVKASNAKLQEASERLKDMEEDRQQMRRNLEDLRGRSASVKSQLREIREAQERSDQQWESLEGEISRIKGQLRDLESPEENPETVGILEAIHATEQKQQACQAELEERRSHLMEATQMRSSAWAERDTLQRHLQQLQRGAFDLEAEKERLAQELEQAQKRHTQATERIVELDGQIQELLKERGLLLDQQQELAPEIDLVAESLRVMERKYRELQQSLERARGLHQETLLQGAQIHGSLEALTREIELTLSLSVPDFLASLTEEEKVAWEDGELVHQTRLNELQSKRLDLGSVNPLAVQELEEAESRLDFMGQQRKDVLDAMANLESTIQDINATSEERFREAFDYINERFTETFRDVFGGGTAHLSLQDPQDLLECGIEIMAQPPGKTAKALTLLSGGEKALTAISLLFAIFKYKPSPFCVLDEVDAPLDEANVGRFAKLVQRMKEGTQFIVITHQKPTMMAADSLYGVTMAERGVSRLVSVHLKEAEALV